MEDILRQPGNYELILNDGTNFNIISEFKWVLFILNDKYNNYFSKYL